MLYTIIRLNNLKSIGFLNQFQNVLRLEDAK